MDDRRYRVDARGVLTELDPLWDTFALANGGPAVVSAQVLGRDLLDFITTPELAHLYAILMHRVRQSGREIVVPFRCDTPALKRAMRMSIAPDGQGGLWFTATLVHKAPRPARLLDVAAGRRSDGTFMRICSWCKRLQTDSGWMEVEDAARQLGLLEADALPQVTHGLCPECEDQLLKAAERSG